MRRGNACKEILSGITQMKATWSSLNAKTGTAGAGRTHRALGIRGNTKRNGPTEFHRILIIWYLTQSSVVPGDDGYYQGGASPPAAVARYDADKAAWDASYAIRDNARAWPVILQWPGWAAANLVKNPGGVIPTGIYRYNQTGTADTLARFKADYALAITGMKRHPTKIVINFWSAGFSTSVIDQIKNYMKNALHCEWVQYSYLPAGAQMLYRWIYSFRQIVEHHALNFQMTPYP